ncbi:flagellar protein FlgN [Loktanella sp. DJP18]|uniref:flagellar protein FlgN n=1 Tax=Loktanella sp. DJP18 TaxID=3409788 RepID=UPI003BB5C76C
MRESVAQTLLTLLETEGAAIRSGRLADLTALADQKIALSRKISETPLDRIVLGRIDRALRRNERLLTAACDGVKCAATRLAALRAVRDGLSLYNEAGNRSTVARRPDALERKV